MNMFEGSLKFKAVFMILLIITMTFSVSNLGGVAAEEVEESKVCCQQTKEEYGGEACVYTSEDFCDENFVSTSTTCEQTSFCEPGLCVDDYGKCSDGVSKSTCDAYGYGWYEGSSYDYDMCQKECCVIAEYQCSYTTENYCEYQIQDLEDIELDWRDVDSESECVDICRSSDKGCCVQDGDCSYTSYGACEEPDIDFDSGNGFYDGEYCSNIDGYCSCISNYEMNCVDEDVYWFDSCGNQEGVVELGDVDSEGEVVGNLNGENGGGDCDYLDDTWCGYDEDDGYTCEDIGCDSTFDGVYYINQEDPYGSLGSPVERNTHDSKLGLESSSSARQHGESWCLYESPAGGFKDFPGSQHYRSYCYFGEEVIEPCEDFREEVCVQSPYSSGRIMDENGIWKNEELEQNYVGPSGSACIDNDPDNYLLGSNISTVSLGGSFWSSSYGSETCEVASVDCSMAYVRDNRADTTFEAASGIMCTSPQWAKSLSEYCQSRGDCGSSMNLVEDYSTDGFSLISSQEFLEKREGDNSSVRVYVGYDSCVNHVSASADWKVYRGEGTGSNDELFTQVEEVNNQNQEAVFCLYECREDDDEACEFIGEVNEDFYDYYDGGESTLYYQKLFALEGEDFIESSGFPSLSFDNELGTESYGVYGGLIGLSLLTEDFEIGDVSSNLASIIALGAVSSIGAAIGAAFVGVSIKMSSSKIAEAILAQEIAKAATQSMTGIQSQLFASRTLTVAGTATKTASTAASGAVILGGTITIVMTALGWVDVVSTTNPEERMQQSNAFAISSGIAAGLTAVSMYIAVSTVGLGPWGWAIGAAALIVAGVSSFLASGGETRDVTISSMCEAWQPPTGSDYCELCDIPVSEGGLAIDDGNGEVLRGWECTEYKCKSLGQGCEYISENVGSDRAKCISVEVNDVNHPIITRAEIVGDYKDINVESFQEGGDYLKVLEKVDPYTYFDFEIETDEPSQCRIEYGSLSETYEDMDLYFPDSYYDYIHNQSWILTPDEIYNFYIRCQDFNGNYNINAFVIQVETDAGEDMTPPSIETTSIKSGSYIANNVNQTQLQIYFNEPVESCRWASTDMDYSLMDNYFACSGIPSSASSLFENYCNGLLNVSLGTNYYYFACDDGNNNTNSESYPFTLTGTEALNLDYASPNGTIYYDYVTLYAETSVGAESGKAVCYYDGIEFYNSNASVHTQYLEDLDAADYEYEISCQDRAGNTNSTSITFTIAIDEVAPVLTSIYVLDNVVYYELDEEVECEYYYEEFEFGAGTDVSGSFALTELETYYLICQDTFSNEGSFVINV
jgi:hypothetical protein